MLIVIDSTYIIPSIYSLSDLDIFGHGILMSAVIDLKNSESFQETAFEFITEIDQPRNKTIVMRDKTANKSVEVVINEALVSPVEAVLILAVSCLLNSILIYSEHGERM